MRRQVESAVMTYLSSAWLPLALALAVFALTTGLILWLQGITSPAGLTHYDFTKDPDLILRQVRLLDIAALNLPTVIGMLVASIYQFASRRWLGAAINVVAAPILGILIMVVPLSLMFVRSQCKSLFLCFVGSDERALRSEFNLPASVELSYLDSPTSSSFFGREGLRIEATFRFSQAQLEGYLAEQIQGDPSWHPLPVPNNLLWHIGRIEGSVEREIAHENWINEQLIEQGEDPWPPVYPDESLRPTEQDRFERFLGQFPDFPAKGYYSCRTAGTNVLYAAKTSCLEPEWVNDYMLAVLDVNTKELWIIVRSYY